MEPWSLRMSESFPVPDPVSTPATAPILDVIARAKARLGPPSMPNGSIRLTFSPRTVTLEMISDSFKGLEDRFPPMLSLEQAADLLGLKEQTIRKHLSEGMGHAPMGDFGEVKDALDAVVARQQAKSIAAGVARGSSF